MTRKALVWLGMSCMVVCATRAVSKEVPTFTSRRSVM